MQVDFLIFDGAPETFDKDIVAPCSLAVHRDFDASIFQHIREGHAGKLASLILVKNLWFSVSKQCLCEGGNAKIDFHRDRQTPRQNPS